jgi:NAD(P)-dependent dehydrogenase (short-subunit alcohol dehydrogenase family)
MVGSQKQLQNKIIVVTGGAGGIGLECAKAYVTAGAVVAIFDRVESQIDKAMAVLGPDNLGLLCDVSVETDVRTSLQRVGSTYGRIDALHNNAGVATPSKPLHETTDAEWNTLFDTNVRSLLYTARYGYPFLRAVRGSILNTSSVVGEIGQELHAAYSATKGAMNALTKSMALDYARDGIRVNAVCPAGAWTPALHQWMTAQPNSGGATRYLDDIHPLGYCPEADVIADACAFLLSEEARFITGHLLNVTGGAELGYRRHRSSP